VDFKLGPGLIDDTLNVLLEPFPVVGIVVSEVGG
jgi:hypothetical protein